MGNLDRGSRIARRSEAQWSVDGPSPALRAVRAEADFVLPYEPRTPDQVELRAELRERLRRLACRDDEVLHASFFGPKPANADVENLLLYNVDDTGRVFAGAARGVRFELSRRPLPKATRAFGWLYRPVPRTAGFALWTEAGTIAAWSDVEVRQPRDRARVWLAFRTAPAGERRPHVGSFGVRVRLTPGDGDGPPAPQLVKPLLDGIVTALQAHADRTTLAAVSDRVATATGVPAHEIERLLGEASNAPLGVVPRLAHLRGDGFQLAPADDRCVAAEVLVEPPSRAAFATASCEVVAVTPR
jgi:hypothetical protein